MENSAPQEAADLDFLKKLTKARRDAAAVERVQRCLRDGNWEVKWNALKAAVKAGCASECADLLAPQIDVVAQAKSKKSYFEKALMAAIKDAGSAIKPFVASILSRAMAPEPTRQEIGAADSDFDDDEDAWDCWFESNSVARSALDTVSKYISAAQAESTFAKLSDPSPQVRAAALHVCSYAMQRFASSHVESFLTASRDPDDRVRSAAADALHYALGDWKFRKDSILGGFAKSRAEHDACKEALLALRSDPSSDVRVAVKDVLELLDYDKYRKEQTKEGGGKAKRAATYDVHEDDDDEEDEDDNEPACCDAPRFDGKLPPAKFILHADGGASELWRCLNCEQCTVPSLKGGDLVEDNDYSTVAQQLGRAPRNEYR